MDLGARSDRLASLIEIRLNAQAGASTSKVEEALDAIGRAASAATERILKQIDEAAARVAADIRRASTVVSQLMEAMTYSDAVGEVTSLSVLPSVDAFDKAEVFAEKVMAKVMRNITKLVPDAAEVKAAYKVVTASAGGLVFLWLGLGD